MNALIYNPLFLVAGASTTQLPFETIIFEPKTFNTRNEAVQYIKDRFQNVLTEKKVCKEECIPSTWELGATMGDYRIYAEKSNALTYHLQSPSQHDIYRLDVLSIHKKGTSAENKSIPVSDIEVKIHKGYPSGQSPTPLFWAYSSDPVIQTALKMALVSGYSVGRINSGSEVPKTYEQITSTIPEDDGVTSMVITYTMLRSNGKYVVFTVQDGYLYLFSEDGFISLNYRVPDFKDGTICDGNTLYTFSPIYRDIPSSVEEAVTMFKPKIKEGKEKEFQDLMNSAMQPGLNWRDKVTSIVQLLNIPQTDMDNTIYTLMRIIGKYKLLKGINLIFSKYPCLADDARTP